MTSSTQFDPGKIQLFLEQADLFLTKSLTELGVETLSNLEPVSTIPATPLQPVAIQDYRSVSSEELARLKSDYFGPAGVAYFIVLNPTQQPRSTHPLLDIATQVADDLSLHHPITHPLEGHPEALKRFGPQDGTLKLYDLTNRDGSTGYREQAETAEMFAGHNDGLGYGGVVQTAVFYLDEPPLFGGYTYFQNVQRLALELARTDYDAYRSLFLPDAICAKRPRGKGAIKVTCPVLYINEDDQPQVFFRISSGEYVITWRDLPALNRAMNFLQQHVQPFSYGSTFVHFTEAGHGCLIRNRIVVHGRTAFVDGVKRKRRLARKWFATKAVHAHYKHVPSIHILKKFADIFPEQFGPHLLEGDWHYDQERDENSRVG